MRSWPRRQPRRVGLRAVKHVLQIVVTFFAANCKHHTSPRLLSLPLVHHPLIIPSATLRRSLIFLSCYFLYAQHLSFFNCLIALSSIAYPQLLDNCLEEFTDFKAYRLNSTPQRRDSFSSSKVEGREHYLLLRKSVQVIRVDTTCSV